MDTQKIKAVLSAVEHKSLSKAAEELSYTPSAFSHIADSLEKELGVKLLKRTYAGVEFTEAGKLLYNKMQSVLRAEKELFEEANIIVQNQSKYLRIGTYSSTSVHVLPEILKEFKKLHPEIKVSITVGESLKNWIDEDLADIVLAVDICALSNEWFPICEDNFVAVVPETEFVNVKTIKCEELYKYAFIKTNDDYVNKVFDMEKFKEIISIASVEDMSVISMVGQGMGIGILPSLILKKKPKGVKTLKLEPNISRTLGFVYKKDNHNLAKNIFVDYLKEKFKQ